MKGDGNGKVKCGKCDNNVTPRLWREWDSSLKKHSDVIKHLCPICGVTMYESIHMTFMQKVMFSLILSAIVYFFYQKHKTGFWLTAGFVVIAGIAYFIIKSGKASEKKAK